MGYFSIAISALLLLTAGVLVTAQQVPCVKSGFTLEIIDASCNFTSLLQVFTPFFNDPINSGVGCKATAEAELIALLKQSTRALAETALSTVCKAAFDAQKAVPFEDIPELGTDFVRQFYEGDTKWNEEYATMYPANTDGSESNLLEDDLFRVDEFFHGRAGQSKVAWPAYISPNFSQCQMNSAYCCWAKDRQANDNNGNCMDPSDAACIDSNPADNTDLCYVKKGSNMAVFQNDDDNMEPYRAEAPIHCHGFAWEDDQNNPSGVYRGNNLFFVSMYDHLYQRGYVKEVPGAPMCGCSEKMPVVSRADCTQLEVVQSFLIQYDGTAFAAKVLATDIEFKSCTGIDQNGEEDDNDLWSHVNRLYIQGKMSEGYLAALTKQLVGDDPNQCRVAEKAAMAADGYVIGYTHDTSKWTKVAGRDVMSVGVIPYGMFSFAEVMAKSTTKIIRRVCPSCYATHQHIFYKRLTAVPSSLDLVHQLKNGRETPDELPGNTFGIDFELYSSYEDAIANTNPWVCPDGYKYEEGFPGDCGPFDVGDTDGQRSIFEWGGSRYDVAFYIDATDPFTAVTSTAIYNSNFTEDGGQRILGRAFSKDNKIYLQDYSYDIWDDYDDFTFKHEKYNGDVEITVKVDSLDPYGTWTKAGLMIRDSLSPGAKNFGLFLSAENGVMIQYRQEDNSWTNSEGHQWNNDIEPKPVWLRIFKQGNTFSAYTSLDGIKWTQKEDDVKLDIGGDIYVGLALCANNWNGRDLAEAVFSNYKSTEYSWPSSAPSSTPAPTTYTVSSRDIGDVNPDFKGKTSYGASTQTYNVTVSGNDIWGTVDGFHFVNQKRAGNFTVTAQVGNIRKLNGGNAEWVLSGVMIRASTLNNSHHMFTGFSNKYGGFKVWRPTLGAETQYDGIDDWEPDAPPSSGWVRVQRQGNMFTAFKSLDGIRWTQIKDSIQMTMPATVEVGLALSAADNWAYATATFRNFVVANLVAVKRD